MRAGGGLDPADDCAGQEQGDRSSNPVPVHLVYLTAWLDREGKMQFRDDHYNLDAPLVAALDANRE